MIIVNPLEVPDCIFIQDGIEVACKADVFGELSCPGCEGVCSYHGHKFECMLKDHPDYRRCTGSCEYCELYKKLAESDAMSFAAFCRANEMPEDDKYTDEYMEYIRTLI